MRFTQILGLSLALGVLFAGTAWATPILVPVIQEESTVTVELCAVSQCDDDTSKVSGQMWIKVLPSEDPTQLILYDYDLALTEQINLSLSWSFLGSLSATGTGMTLAYATPFQPLSPTPISGGAFVLSSVPSQATGIVNYNASGIPCSALQGAGMPCSDSLDLADQGSLSGEMSGTVSVSPARIITVQMNPDVSGPLMPENPDLGTISMAGTVIGEATIPVRGDVNGDGKLNGLDVQGFVDVLLDPDAYDWAAQFVVDMNDDDAFDLDDADLFVGMLLGTGTAAS